MQLILVVWSCIQQPCCWIFSRVLIIVLLNKVVIKLSINDSFISFSILPLFFFVFCFYGFVQDSCTTVESEKALESPLDWEEIQPVHPRGSRSRVFTGRTDVKAETPVFRPPDMKSWLIWKDPDVGKYWRQEEKGTTEDEKVKWSHAHRCHRFFKFRWWLVFNLPSWFGASLIGCALQLFQL